MYPNIVNCFMCTNKNNCSAVNDKIVTQVEYLLPEITIIKRGIPLCICSICERSLQSFSRFKDVSVENNLRLEARLKYSLGSTDKAANLCEAMDFERLIDSEKDESVASNLRQHKFEDTLFLEKIIKTALCSKDSGSVSNDQMQPNSVDSDNKFEDSLFIERIIKKVINSVVSEKKIVNRNMEEFSIMDEPREKTPFDREFYNYLVQNTATEESVIDNNITCSEDNQIDTKCDTEDKNIQPTTDDQKFKIYLPTVGNIKESQLRTEERAHTYDSMIRDSAAISTNTSDQNDTSKTSSENIEEIFIKQEVPEEISMDSSDCNNENTTKNEHIPDESANTVIVDNGKKHFQCSICLQIFARKCGFVVHMAAHNRPKYVKCNKCNTYIDKKVLGSHIKTHSEVNNSHEEDLDVHCHERRDFQCPTCNKMFKLKSNLETHIKIHTAVKDFKCQVCDKLFLLKANLQDHMDVHNNPI